jgi:hypothetical protein
VAEQRTLDELDPPAWGEPTYGTHLVTRCHELRRKPLDDFTVEDLRIMIGQQIALSHLVPLALLVLEANPLAEGDFYRGDLLNSVLRVEADYWQEHQDEWIRTHNVIEGLLSTIDDLQEAVESFRRLTQA